MRLAPIVWPVKLTLVEVRVRKDEILSSQLKPNTLDRTTVCLVEAGRELSVQVIGLLDSDFPARIENAERGAPTDRVSVISPGLPDRFRFDLRGYRAHPWIDGRRLGNGL